MDNILVIARAYRGEPLKRVALSTGHGLVYVANPDVLKAIRSGESSPVGFPAEDVFEFDADLYARLRSQWEREGQTEGGLWRSAHPWANGRQPSQRSPIL